MGLVRPFPADKGLDRQCWTGVLHQGLLINAILGFPTEAVENLVDELGKLAPRPRGAGPGAGWPNRWSVIFNLKIR